MPRAANTVAFVLNEQLMKLKRISLTNFRNFSRLDTDVPDNRIILVGDNAQGKTSLLEAVFYLATFTSIHADSDRQLINFIASKEPLAVARVVAEFERGSTKHEIEVRIIKEGKNTNETSRIRKEVLLDSSRSKVSDTVGKFMAVMFLPQMLQIITGAPAERRRYLNLAISQVQPQYAASLSDYAKIVSRRNALLKQLGEQGGDRGQLDFWDERLSVHGANLIYNRIQAVHEIERIASRVNQNLTQCEEVLRLNYLPSYDPASKPSDQISMPIDTPIDRSSISEQTIQDGFHERLVQIRSDEIIRGVTTIGPHRDDIRFLGNGIDLGTYGSRGQVRTTMLTLKFAEAEWMYEKSNRRPVLLLDEVLAELDVNRRLDLLQHMADGHQTLLTTTDINLFDKGFLENAVIWKIQSGRLLES